MRQHRLSEYIAALGAYVVESSVTDDPVITQVTYDSREVIPGALFICKGLHFVPSYVEQAVARGAVAYVGETVYSQVSGISWVTVSDIRAAIAQEGTLFYDHEWDQLIMAGITGTKGKSTTTCFLHAILTSWLAATGGPRPGIISSIHDDDGLTDVPAIKTTPETLDLYKHLHNAVGAGLRYLCMEVSSQGLRYGRVANLRFDVGCFLNISEDHISPREHPNYEDYLTAKLMLFDQSRVAVVNAHTQERDRVMAAAAQCERVVTFALESPGSTETADVVGYGAAATETGQEFRVRYARWWSGEDSPAPYAIGLLGGFNVDNALAAISLARCLGVPEPYIRTGLASARVPGRMETFRLARGTTVIVDYAHQKLSVEALLETVRQRYPSAPISMMFGTGGNVGWNRREEFGTLAGRYAERVYLTEDDPGDKAVAEIARDIDRYVQATGHVPAVIQPDRPRAVEQALDEAPDDGLVLLLGKGAEQWQMRATGPVAVPSDIDVVREYLARQGS